MKFISWNIDSLNAALTSDSDRAALSRQVISTIAGEDPDVIAIQETKLSVAGPNKKQDAALMRFFPVWDKLYADYLSTLDSKKPVIACGDFNCAHEEIDLAHPENNHFSAGFTDEEREGFSNLLSRGFVDTFRLQLAEKFAFGGEGRQEELLRSEGVLVTDGKVDLDRFGWKE